MKVVILSGPLWPDPYHNSKRATLYSSSVPIPGNQLDKRIAQLSLVLTTNGEIYNDNTYFILDGGEKSYERFVRIDRVEGVE